MLWVRLPPLLSENRSRKSEVGIQNASTGHWRASVAVTHPRKRCPGSTPARRTESEVRDQRSQNRRVLVGLSGCGRRVFTPEIAGSNPAQDAWPSGGMGDAAVSKAVALGREGSSPSLATWRTEIRDS